MMCSGQLTAGKREASVAKDSLQLGGLDTCTGGCLCRIRIVGCSGKRATAPNRSRAVTRGQLHAWAVADGATMPCCCRKYHILRYEPITNSPLLHHGVAYTCDAKAAAAVKALKSMGPFDRCVAAAAATAVITYSALADASCVATASGTVLVVKRVTCNQ
jgi:hypothetical protein